MPVPNWARQGGFDVRFDWGPAGVAAVAGDGVVVVVDVLRFTTTVEAATGRGVLVYPYRWRDETAAAFASTVEARLADGADRDGPSPSPSSFVRLEPGERVVLTSPQRRDVHGVGRCPSLAGGRSVPAQRRNGGRVAPGPPRDGTQALTVIACGERWPDDTLRPALEDLLGAGAVLARLGGNQSPEARAAVAAWTSARDHIDTDLTTCASGQELIERGHHDDVV